MHKQLDALKHLQKLLYSGAVPLCEQFLKPLVCEVFLNQVTTHRSVKILAYKLIYQLSSFFDIVYILRMDDEPAIAKDLFATILSDS